MGLNKTYNNIHQFILHVAHPFAYSASVLWLSCNAKKEKRKKKILIRCKLDVFEQDKVLYNEKVAQIALEEAGAASTNVKTFDELMKELAELESRIQQSADQSASVRVANLT